MRKNIIFLGSGNVATFMARRFKKSNNNILQVYSQNLEHAHDFAAEFHCQSTNDLAALNKDGDLYIIAVKDDAIEEVISKADFKDKLVVHTSGMTSKNVLADASTRSGVLYPFQTIKKEDKNPMEQFCVFFDGNSDEALAEIEEYAFELSNYAQMFNDEERQKYHLAGVFTNNFMNHLAVISEDYMVRNELDFEFLKPMILKTCNNIIHRDPYESQTGPAIRKDEKTIAGHLELMVGEDHMKELYTVLTKSIQSFTPAEKPDLNEENEEDEE